MSVVGGTKLGPYEILAPLGAGGMGEVFRAKDTRLDRTVALKILPEDFLKGEESRQRFEREARTLASLNHPNIAVLYAFEEAEGRHLLAMELLEGETLREKLGSPLPPKKAAEYVVQVAHGLAAAHEKGIVHRDLKPENLFVTRDGRIKILDFGIAKLTQPAVPSVSLTQAPTAAPATDAGVVLGTVGYMSPEQVLGKALDARTDLFSLGVVLYEMLAGKRPFQKQTAPETLAAILREEPPELSEINRQVPPGLDRIVRHCLEKDPGNRFQSARDVAFALEPLSQSTTAGTAPLRSTSQRRRLAAGALAAVVLAAAGAGLFGWGKQSARAPWPTFKRLTFRRGIQGTAARFTPDYQSIVYSARWEDKPFFELFVQRLASADARSLGLRGAEVAGTAGGDVAVVGRNGILAQLPLEGGTPRELLKDVREASWDPTGSKFAVVRVAGARWRLEYPAGKLLVETTGLEWLSLPRVSPDGKRVAFLLRDGYGGAVCMVDLSGQKKTLSKGLIEVWGLVWSPDGQEIWFSAARSGPRLSLYAVTLSGRERLVARFPGSVYIRDIAPDGHVLLKYGLARRHELRGRLAGDAAERDLSWLDGESAPRIAPDGKQLLFQEWGEGGFRADDPHGGTDSSIYHWRLDGSAPKRLGPGRLFSVSPDWTTALVQTGGGAKNDLNLVPIGAGETTTLARGPIQNYSWGYWHPDGKRIVVKGTDAEGQRRLYLQDVSGGLPRPFGRFVDEGADPFSPDGRYVATRQKEGEPCVLCPIDGGETRPIPFLKVEDEPLVFGDDGKSLFVAANLTWPVRVERIELRTGKREPWLELAPPDRAGVSVLIQSLDLSPNGRFYAYGYWSALSDLYLVEGLK